MAHEEFMRIALQQAQKAYKKDEVPVGAIIVKEGKILAKAFNKREKSKDATNHAEIICIKKACKKIKDFRLLDCDIYVTLEPCLMCLGALINARVRTIYFGASINKVETIKTSEIVERAGLNHKCEVVGGILEQECGSMVSNYFKDKRKSKKQA